MTAITLDAPVRRRRTARPAAPAGVRTHAGPRRGEATRRAVPAAASGVGRAGSPARPLRLTRRGRLVITALLLSIGVVASLFAGGVSLAGTHAQPVPVRYVTVEPGQTLWAIAGEIAPTVDRRDTVARIVDLNAMTTSGVQAGQRIAVPAR